MIYTLKKRGILPSGALEVIYTTDLSLEDINRLKSKILADKILADLVSANIIRLEYLTADTRRPAGCNLLVVTDMQDECLGVVLRSNDSRQIDFTVDFVTEFEVDDWVLESF